MIGVSDSENGETPIFLRGKDADGTPQNIWGAIVDTYVNKTDGGLLSCGKFLYLNAGDGQTDYAAATSPGTEPSTHDSWTCTATHHSPGPCSKKPIRNAPRTPTPRIPRLHLAGHGPKRRRLPPPAQNTIGGRPLKTRRHLQARRARHTRIHPPRPRNRRRLQPVQRKLPQHGRQNGPRRHPAKHPDTLRRIRKANQRTTRIRTHQPTANMATQHCPHGRARAWPAKCALVCRPRSARSRSRRRPSIGRCSASRAQHANRRRQGTYPRHRRRSLQQLGKDLQRVRQDIDEASSNVMP